MLKNKFIQGGLWLFLLVVVSIFGYSLFKNIQYPLLWGDESEIMVFAQRILKYGYPKVNDGKNILNMTMIPEREVGVKESLDAWIHLPWLQYYFATIGEVQAQKTNDLYLKTFWARLPFAAAGFMAVTAFPFLFFSRLKGGKKIIAATLYFLFIIPNIPLVLHLKEVRSYSLNLLLLGIAIWLFVRSEVEGKLHFYGYLVLYLLLSVLLFNNYPPSYIALSAAMGTYVIVKLIRYKKKAVESVKRIFAMLTASVFAIFPFLIFYETFYVSQKNLEYFPFVLSQFIEKITRVGIFFLRYDFASLLILLALFAVLVYKGKNNLETDVRKDWETVFFLCLFMTIYALVTAFQPYIFDRYFFVLSPFLAIVLVKLILLIINSGRVKSKILLYYLATVFYVINIVPKIDVISGHVYELEHVYKGPLDYSIPFIRENVPNIENMVINTNNEQTSYVYYLGSKVLLGYDKDSSPISAPADIVIPVNYLESKDKYSEAIGKLKTGDYDPVYFGIENIPANNIPELSLPLRHRFQTPLTDDKTKELVLYISRKND